MDIDYMDLVAKVDAESQRLRERMLELPEGPERERLGEQRLALIAELSAFEHAHPKECWDAVWREAGVAPDRQGVLVLVAMIKSADGSRDIRLWAARSPETSSHDVYVAARDELAAAGYVDKRGLPLGPRQFSFLRTPFLEPDRAIEWARAEYQRAAAN